MLPGQNPPSGFVLLGSTTIKVQLPCNTNPDCDGTKNMTLNVFVKQ
jgi:hypothetical protein